MTELSEGEAESDLVRQLRVLANAGPDVCDFVFVRAGGLEIRAHYSGGSGSYLSLKARYGFAGERSVPAGAKGYRDGSASIGHVAHRPMNIWLRPESVIDAKAKLARVSKEFQTGDATFDQIVYCETDASDETLRYVLASPELRLGTLALLREGLREITLDDDSGDVYARLFLFASKFHDARRAERILAAFEAIARNAPAVRASSERRPRDLQRLWVNAVAGLSALLFLGGIPLYFFLVPGRCWEPTEHGEGANLRCSLEGCCSPILPGLLLGLVLAVVLGWLVPKSIRGRSDSHKRRGVATVGVALLAFELTMFFTAVYTWYLR